MQSPAIGFTFEVSDTETGCRCWIAKEGEAKVNRPGYTRDDYHKICQYKDVDGKVYVAWTSYLGGDGSNLLSDTVYELTAEVALFLLGSSGHLKDQSE